MTDTANLALPCIEGSQAQKHVTHNEALRVLDTVVQLAVLDRDLTAPPGAPTEGQRWIVKTGATGAWVGRGNAIAAWQDGAWQYSTPRLGWLAYVIDESALLVWNGSAWGAALGLSSSTRELLTANRTYYVRTDGNDSNNGLANTAGGAFLTIQKAIDTAASLDLGIYSVAIAIADGTYTGALTPKSLAGSGGVSITGNVTTPANVLISVTGAHCVVANGVRGTYTLSGMKLQANTSGYGAIIASQGSIINTGVIDFGAVGSGGTQVSATYGARIVLSANYTISGGGGVHWYATTQGLIQAAGKTITLSGTPAFSSAFALASQGGGMVVSSNVFSGAATGTRYSAAVNAWIDTGAAGASYLPGSVAGSTATGGQYT